MLTATRIRREGGRPTDTDQGMRDAVLVLLTSVYVCVFGEAELSTKLTDRRTDGRTGGRTNRHDGYSREAGKELKNIRWVVFARQHETRCIYT